MPQNWASTDGPARRPALVRAGPRLCPDHAHVTSDSTGERTCPACGIRYPASTRFCPSDGQPLREEGRADDALVGSLVADRYYVERRLGLGGMGVVYLAQQVFMSRPCALKVLRPEYLTSSDALGRFTRGAQNASRVAHPNVAAIYDFGELDGESMYLAMEYVDGPTLGALIESSGPLPIARCVTIVSQVASALRAAHDLGIVHRDLKPDNIMLARIGDADDLVKVVDFGIARAMFDDDQRVTQSNAVVGTPAYMSPEQLSGRPVDARSDLYSLALVCYAMLTGALPYSSDPVDLALRFMQRPKSLRELQPATDWPRQLQEVLDRALSSTPDERQESVSQFAKELIEAVRGWRPTEIATAASMLAKLGADLSLTLTPETLVRIATPHTAQPIASAESPAKPARTRQFAATLLLAVVVVGSGGIYLAARRDATNASTRPASGRGDTSSGASTPAPLASPAVGVSPPSRVDSAPGAPAMAAGDTTSVRRSVNAPVSRNDVNRNGHDRTASLSRDRGVSSPGPLASPGTTSPQDSGASAPPQLVPALPSNGTIRIGSSGFVGAALYLNDRLVGVVSSLRSLNVAPGPVRIRLSIERCQDWDSTITVQRGDTITIGYRRPVCPP